MIVPDFIFQKWFAFRETPLIFTPIQKATHELAVIDGKLYMIIPDNIAEIYRDATYMCRKPRPITPPPPSPELNATTPGTPATATGNSDDDDDVPDDGVYLNEEYIWDALRSKNDSPAAPPPTPLTSNLMGPLGSNAPPITP
ncbi:hypothetical protein BU17DRAFT_60731 [Hysterangium stoloniferum]|nr:hypothetical protein BU17DRAFT_60731 [Hysterangium stoloniferum]